MAHLTPGEKYIKILKFISDSEVPVSRLQIARELGYRSTTAIHKTLRALEKDDLIQSFHQPKPNGTIRYVYVSKGLKWHGFGTMASEDDLELDF